MNYILLGLVTSIVMLHAVTVGEKLPNIILDKANGGDSAEKAWHATSLKGKVHVVLYMDPDKRKEAMPFLNTLHAKHFDTKQYSTVAIVNLAATWMPDAVLEALLTKKQKELQNTVFIFDKTKYLVKKWKMKDDASNVLVCDKEGKVLYQKSEKLLPSDVQKIMDIIAKNIQ